MTILEESTPAKTTNQFLLAGNSGRNSVWRYFATLLIVIAAVFTINSLAGFVVIAAAGTTDLQAMPPNLLFLLAMSTFPAAALALLYCVQIIHRRKITTLVTPFKRPEWRWFWISGLLWLSLSVIADVVMAFVLTPGNYQFTLNPSKFMVFTLLALCFLPIQTSTEELLFRSYLLQGLSRLARPVWIPVGLTSMAFAGLHTANPEVSRYGFWTMMAFYFGIGLLLAWVTLFTEGLEAALGLHLANNLYAALLVTFPGSALETPALFTLKVYFPALNLVVFLALSAVYIIIIKQLKHRLSRVGESKEDAEGS